MPRLSGKTAFLTGEGAGIAKVSALEFVKEGARVDSAQYKQGDVRWLM